MGLKSKLTYILIHKNQRIDEEFDYYSRSLRQKKIDKFKRKKNLDKVTLNSLKPNIIDQGKKLFVLGMLNMHYRIFRKDSWFFKTLQCGIKRKPYMLGAESMGYQKEHTPQELVEKLAQFDVISFDIFDTLILRPFQNPSDLFMLVGHRLNQQDFRNIRIKAETKIRNKNINLGLGSEVTIYDIYNEVNRCTGVDVEIGLQTEFQTEKDFCFANPYMKQVYDGLIALGKTVIITSDMYYPHDMMVELLTSCGYTGFDKLYVSCDYNASKRDGHLYNEISKDYRVKKIIHVGDNFVSDIISANEKGLDTHYYANCHEQGLKHRAGGMSELVGSFYSGIVNT
ncbi:MAG: hypothetical protein J6V40_01915, partial [Clostridia bacterium]|nr:hypothetical protein [Clostridia bacterium]